MHICQNSAPTTANLRQFFLLFFLLLSTGTSHAVSLTLLADGQPVLGQTLHVEGGATLSFTREPEDAIVFYTLDGTAPGSNSIPYREYLALTNFFVGSNCVLRAVAFTQDDVSESVTNASVSITVQSGLCYLYSAPSGGGTVTFDLPGNRYASNTLVTVTAAANEGWTFMGWQGDLSGTNATASIRMGGTRSIHALFGAPFAPFIGGNGTFRAEPSLPLYPYGATVRLFAFPSPGNCVNYWGYWVGDFPISDYRNPLSMRIVYPDMNPGIRFRALPANSAALTVDSSGSGMGIPESQDRYFQIGTAQRVFAYPDPGQRFLGWSGDASGTNNPLSVLMDSSKSVTARFTTNSTLGLEATGGSIRLSIAGQRGGYRIESSTDLSAWAPLATVTNYFGEATFLDVSPSAAAKMYRAVKP